MNPQSALLWRRAAALLLLVAMAATLMPSAALAKGPPWARGTDGNQIWMPYGQAKKLGWLFADMAEAPWAAPYVAELQYLGIFQGDGGLFQPNRSATRLEVIITALRLLGREDDAAGLDASFEAWVPPGLRSRAYLSQSDSWNLEVSDDLLKFLGRAVPKGAFSAVPGWGLGYVLLAIQEGLIVPEGKVNLMAAAGRLEAAVILVRALGRDAEARARAGEALAFTDAAQVPASAAGYVLIAVQEGILNGYPDGSLRPNKAITRAELAAVLSRLGEGRIPAGQVQGTLLGVAAGPPASIHIRMTDNTEATYSVRADAPVFLNNQAATLADLRPGDPVRLYLDAEGAVALIRATKATASAEGVIAALSAVSGGGLSVTLLPDSGSAATYAVAAGVPVYEGTQARSLSDLRVGLRVKLTLESNAVVRVDLLTPVASTAGTVVSTATNAFGHPASILLQLQGGLQATYNVSPTVEVRLAGTPVNFSGILAGDQASLTFNAGLVVRIDLAARAQTVTGWVYGTATNAFGHPTHVTLRNNVGTLVTYPVPGSVEVYEGTSPATFGSLRAHDKVELTLASGTATTIKILTRAETFEGTISAVDGTAKTFTVQRLAADGVTTVFRTFGVTDDTYMVHGSTAIGLGDLAVGQAAWVAAHAASGGWQAVYVERR